jgi:hypothetical protein
VATASCVFIYRYLTKKELTEFETLVTKASKAKKAGDPARAANLFDEAVQLTTQLPQAQQASQDLIFKVAYECGQLSLTAGRPQQAEKCFRKALAACQR